MIKQHLINAIEIIINVMSCHYSCQTCLVNFYLDGCLTCPSSRQLQGNICVCSSNFYESQTQACASELGGLDGGLLAVGQIGYYVAIGLHLLAIVMIVNRICSIKMKRIIDLFQILALIQYYRFRQQALTDQYLTLASIFNFSYFQNLLCSSKGLPQVCNQFQNIIGIILTLCMFVFLLFLSYLLGYCLLKCKGSSGDEETQIIYIGRKEQSQNIGFVAYFKAVFGSFVMIYLDQTAIQTTLGISRLLYSNILGFILGVPFLVLLFCIIRTHFKTINTSKQFSMAYRNRYSYYYLYDEFYHLQYIDHIFEQQQNEESNQRGNTGVFDRSQKQKNQKRFYPQSNLMIMEVIFKVFIAATTILCFQYSPYLFAYAMTALLIIYSLFNMTFCFYQRSQLCFLYFILMIYLSCVGTFYTVFFKYYFVFAIISLFVFMILYMILAVAGWKQDKEGVLFKRWLMVADQDQQQSEAEIANSNDQQARVEVVDSETIPSEKYKKSKRTKRAKQDEGSLDVFLQDLEDKDDHQEVSNLGKTKNINLDELSQPRQRQQSRLSQKPVQQSERKSQQQSRRATSRRTNKIKLNEEKQQTNKNMDVSQIKQQKQDSEENNKSKGKRSQKINIFQESGEL